MTKRVLTILLCIAVGSSFTKGVELLSKDGIEGEQNCPTGNSGQPERD
jgi:hypothetical protein